MLSFPETLTRKQVKRLIEFLSHQVGVDGKRMTQAEVKEALAETMPRDNATGRPVDEDNYPFDPGQVDRRKRGVPKAFCRSAEEYIEKKYDVLDKYFIFKNVLEMEIDAHDYMYRSVAERQFGVRGETLGSIKEMADSLHLSKRIFEKQLDSKYFTAYYLIVTMINDIEISVAPMIIELEDDELAIPKFNTKHYLGGEITNSVSGFMMEASKYVYTIGQDFGQTNLRISKLQVQPRIKDDPDNPNRYDLVGLRVGGFSAKPRPNTHRVFAYQIVHEEHMGEVTDNIIKMGSARNYEGEGITIPQGLSKDFSISPSMAETIYKFLIAPSETRGHLDTPPIEPSL